MSKHKHNTIYIVAMRNHNLYTTVRGSKPDINGILFALLSTGWIVQEVTKTAQTTRGTT